MGGGGRGVPVASGAVAGVGELISTSSAVAGMVGDTFADGGAREPPQATARDIKMATAASFTHPGAISVRISPGSSSGAIIALYGGDDCGRQPRYPWAAKADDSKSSSSAWDAALQTWSLQSLV